MIITRSQGQSMVVEMYSKYRALACFYCTGFGKGKAALDAIKTHKCDPNKRDWSGLIICHSEGARDIIWPQQIAEWAPEYLKCIGKQIQLCCYPSLNKYAGHEFDWAIGDEFHYMTPVYYERFKTFTYKGLLMLTATEPEDWDKKEIINRLSKGHKLEIKLDTAVDSKVLNDYRIRVWYVPLLESEKSMYLHLSRILQNAKQSGKDFLVKKAAGTRMRYIYNLESKYQAACWLRDQIRAKGKRFVMHCGSIDMANRLSDYRYHSETDDVHFKLFLASKINEIASVKQIKEGQNIDRLESSIVVQLNSKQHNIVQQIGRNMRLEPDELAIIHILIAHGTVDENWMTKALASFNQNKISYHSIKQEDISHYK